jgi:peptidyl-prolyl cis-trans isomerase D
MADPQASFFWAALEPQVRKELKRIRVQQLVVQAPHVSEGEVKRAFMEANEQVQVAMVNVQMGDFSNQIGDPEEEKLRAYFEENKEKYDVEERRVLTIAKFDKEPSEDDLSRALAQATAIADSAKAGADFAELARNWSDDNGTGDNGGDLGWVAEGRMVPEFDSAAFAMSEGEISAPVKTLFGYHIVKNDGYRDIEAPNGTTLHQAKLAHILIRTQPSDVTLARGLELMDSLYAKTLDTDMETAAAGLGVELEQTEPLLNTVRTDYLGSASSHHILEWAFEAEVGDVSEPMENDACYSVIRVDEIVPAGPAEFEDVRQRVRADYRYVTAQQLCRDTMAAVYTDVEAGLSLENAAYKHNLEFEFPISFTRNQNVAELVNDPAAIGAAFTLEEPGEMLGPLDYKGGTVIMELLSRTEPDLSQYNEQRDSIYTALINSKQQQTWQNWFTTLHESSDIINNVITQRARRMY